MKIKVLHYVFGPCTKGYDIYERKPVVQMGQKTIGLSGDLLSQPEILAKLEELAFGDALEPNMPFEKLYFTGLPGHHRVIGRGIRGMDSTGRKAYFFHHLVIEEPDLIKIKANPFAVFKKFPFFEKESDLPEDRLIPPTEIEISAQDCEFPLLDELKKPILETLLADLFTEPTGLPLWVILKRGEESLFLQQLLGLLPFKLREQTGFSTDFYNSYNIQHHFRLVTVNSTREIPYESDKIYNFVDWEFPGTPAGKNDYIKVISQLAPGEIKTLVEDISCLQLNYKETGQLTQCREILRTYSSKDKRCLPAFFDITPRESAVVLLGIGHPGSGPDYGFFCDFYRNFADRISPAWFLTLPEPLEPSPISLQVFTALFKLLETPGIENTTFRDNLFQTAVNHLKTTGRGELLNLLWAQFPLRFTELMGKSPEKTQWLIYLVQLPGMEKGPRRQVTEEINRSLLDQASIQVANMDFLELPALIRFLGSQDIDASLLKALLEMDHIRETGESPTGGIGKYSFEKTLYRELVRIGMKMVKDKSSIKSLQGMLDFLYEPGYPREFIEAQLEVIRGEWLNIEPVELFVYWESRDWVDLESRWSILGTLGQGTWKLSRVKKYQKYLKESGKDRPEYKPLWEAIIENAQEGLLGSIVRKIKDLTGRFYF